MNIHDVHWARPARTVLATALLAALSACSGSICVGFDGCGSDGRQPLALSGTAATGSALAGATVSFNCAAGAASTRADGGGHYSATFDVLLPCVITASTANATLHSVAFAGGTFNTTPETELMLVYLAAQLGTTEAGLIAGVGSNGRFQRVLSTPDNVLAAQQAVVTNLQQRYAVTLAAPAFLTTPFVVGQPGVDSDLDALATAGAIDANGMPDATAVSLLTTAGRANPLGAK